MESTRICGKGMGNIEVSVMDAIAREVDCDLPMISSTET